MGPIQRGQAAPDFDLMDQSLRRVRLADFRGSKKVILLFYPMDFHPICTQEHCTYGPQLGRLRADEDTVIFGVSCDSPFSHAAFKKQYNIPYDLLSDPTRDMVKAYGMWTGEHPFNCAKRGTVAIDKLGRVTFSQETPFDQPRPVEEIDRARAAIIDVALEQRANEFGEAV
jgi:peroxiredoxin